jgi:hypothetical protein
MKSTWTTLLLISAALLFLLVLRRLDLLAVVAPLSLMVSWAAARVMAKEKGQRRI